MSFWQRGVALLALSAGAAAISPSCAETLDGDDDGEGGEDGGGDGGGSGRTSCEDFADASPSTIPVTWVNSRDITIYVWLPRRPCELRAQFGLNYDGLTVPLDRQECVPTCGGFQDAPVACEESCPAPQMYRIEPGARYTFDWVPVFYDFSQMPAECWHEDQPTERQPACDTKALLEEKTYGVVGEYYFDTLVKAPGAGSMEYGCPCADGSSSDVCITVDGCSPEGGGATIETEATLPNDGAILIDVHI